MVSERVHSTDAVAASASSFANATSPSPVVTQTGATLDDLRDLANTMPQLAWIADPNGWIYWYNDRWYEYTGADFESMQGWGWRSVHHPDHVDRVEQRVRHSWETGEAWEDLFPLRRHDGEFRWFLSRALPRRDESGRILRWLGTNTDVTEQIAAEAAMRRSEERFRTVVDASADIIWTADAAGQIAGAQTSLSAFTGRSAAELRGAGWLEMIHPEDRDRSEETWRHAAATRETYRIEHRILRRDGEYRHMDGCAVPVLEEDGRVREWIGIHTDITPRKRAEEELQAARDSAEAANRAKSQFIANMSHELRTPLSAVIGYSEMLAEEIEDLGHAHLRKDLDKIEASARHLLSLINDVLDLSKIEAGRMTISTERFATQAMLDDVISAAGSLAARKSNALRLDIQGELGGMNSDQVKIRQCLLNLLGNASKFTENGIITLSARREEQERQSWMVFTVRDTGIGMTEEQLGRLFQRFSQADESTTRQFGGTGLGLAITRAFCEKLGGGVSVTSEPDRGSAFIVRLPAEYRTAEAEDAPRTAASAPATDPGRTVLVVDDDPAARELLTRFLEREGFAVRCASDGRMGLEMARALHPRAVLLDVEMPQMDGWAVLHAIRTDPALRDTPVIMASVVNEQGLGYALGATDYLTKPIEWGRLKDVMDHLRARGSEGEVLVIDDDAMVRDRLRHMLAQDGWTIREATNGRHALEQVSQRLPALILLDLNMPVMDGFGFLKQLRARPDGQDVPVVVLTAEDVTPEQHARLDRQADRVIVKGSISLGDLARELRDIVPPPEAPPLAEPSTSPPTRRNDDA